MYVAAMGCRLERTEGNKLRPDIKTPYGLVSQPLGCRAVRSVIHSPNRFLGDTVTETHEMADSCSPPPYGMPQHYARTNTRANTTSLTRL